MREQTGWLIAACVLVACTGPLVAGPGDDWIEFVEETAERLLADPGLGVNDPEEKDFAWADLDLDGDVDLIVARKQPFTTPGGRANVLLMNEGTAEGHAVDGVLVDRTADLASAADDGGQGFLDPTNDRDVVIADVDQDGWPDVVTAVTLSDGLPQSVSHPRVYRNLGELDGLWQGLRYESARIPGFDVAPRFNAVAAGDVTGDGFVDLYFVDSDSGGAPPGGIDLNDRLLQNDGHGFFEDVSAEAMTEQMLNSAMGTAAAIADMNGDGFNDVVKSSVLNAPTYVAISYNGPDGFGAFDPISTNAPYFFSVGDLNGDGRLDVVVTDAGVDRYLLNQGNDVDGLAEFITHAVSFQSGGDQGFGGNSLIEDLDADGFADVLITDIDIDLPGCSRRMHLFRNLGDGPDVTLQDQGTAAIPEVELEGTHDVAVFDLDGDGMLDMVLGRCVGTRVWINRTVRLDFSFAAPALVPADEATAIQVQIEAIGNVEIEAGSPSLQVSVDGGDFVTSPLASLGGTLYEGLLPAVPCGTEIAFSFSAETTGGGVFVDPPDAPEELYSVIAVEGTELLFDDAVEGDVSGWTVSNDPAEGAGGWEQAIPVGTTFNGQPAAPSEDATADPDGDKAFVTGNGLPGGNPGADDVDGGPKILLSPPVDLEGADAIVGYARWFSCDDEGTQAGDALLVEISGDGGESWAPLEAVTVGAGVWVPVVFRVSEVLEAADVVRLRFSTGDSPNNSITEAGIDDVRIERIVCATCAGDVDGDGLVGVLDLVSVILDWGPCGDPCPSDLSGDGLVGVEDLVDVILAWGDCL